MDDFSDRHYDGTPRTQSIEVIVHRCPLSEPDNRLIECYSCKHVPAVFIYEIWFGTEQIFLCYKCMNDAAKLMILFKEE